jgi:DNA invertase Pin-like site-specific DNA recombinase
LSTPAGVFQSQVLAALAEYERTIIVDRVRLGLARARRDGVRLGRPPIDGVSYDQLAAVAHLPLTVAARELHVSRSSLHRWRKSRCG